MEGFQLCARFSLVTNRRRYCGPADAPSVLYRAIVDGSGRAEAEAALSRFEALFPYLDRLAKAHGLSPFDREVVEAYWIGNRLLDAFPREGFAAILDDLRGRGLPGFVARDLSGAMQNRPLPHHAFHVAFVGVGAVTGHVPTNVENMDSCRPSWAEVISVDGPDRLVVRVRPLEVDQGALRLGAPVERVISFDPAICPGLRESDVVAVHWGWATMRLGPDQLRRLEEYTLRSLEAANESSARLRSREPPAPPGGST